MTQTKNKPLRHRNSKIFAVSMQDITHAFQHKVSQLCNTKLKTLSYFPAHSFIIITNTTPVSKNAFIAGIVKSAQIEKYINKLKEKFYIADLESNLTVIYREELKKAKANQKFIAIKGALIFANETTLHTFLKEIAVVFLINISINNSVISSEVENVVDWDIKI